MTSREGSAPNPNQPCPLKTQQQSSCSHWIPLLAAAKCWHLPSIQFPRHGVETHKACRPNLAKSRRERPRAQVSGNHMRQRTSASASWAWARIKTAPEALAGCSLSHCRLPQVIADQGELCQHDLCIYNLCLAAQQNQVKDETERPPCLEALSR